MVCSELVRLYYDISHSEGVVTLYAAIWREWNSIVQDAIPDEAALWIAGILTWGKDRIHRSIHKVSQILSHVPNAWDSVDCTKILTSDFVGPLRSVDWPLPVSSGKHSTALAFCTRFRIPKQARILDFGIYLEVP